MTLLFLLIISVGVILQAHVVHTSSFSSSSYRWLLSSPCLLPSHLLYCIINKTLFTHTHINSYIRTFKKFSVAHVTNIQFPVNTFTFTQLNITNITIIIHHRDIMVIIEPYHVNLIKTYLHKTEILFFLWLVYVSWTSCVVGLFNIIIQFQILAS